MNHKREVRSWGNSLSSFSDVKDLFWSSEKILFDSNKSYLPVGLKRSYGDCCLNDDGINFSSTNLRKFIDFDREQGILNCQSGVSLEDILDFAVPRGWFLPVTPGTKFVTVGGAIANDVHGKNHHIAGTFGEHILELELLRSDGQRLVCSKASNPEMFRATIAGLGLTGLILSAKIKLIPIKSAYMQCRNIFFDNLDQFLEVSAKYANQYEYSVAWMDCASKGSQFGRGIFMCGNHSDLQGKEKSNKQLLDFPLNMPSGFLNNIFVSIFNQTYFSLKKNSKQDFTVHYNPYFYPLDAIGSWNRVYGKKGFFQFQCVVPYQANNNSTHQIFYKVFEMLQESDYSSYLTVVKEFSGREPAGLMSFPRQGITACFDIPNKGKGTIDLIKKMNDFVCESGGALYPAKDAVMSAENFKASYPNLSGFSNFIDNKFSSDFWKRVNK